MAKAPAARPTMREIAVTTGGRDITRGFIDGLELLRPQDSVLLAKGGDYRVYEEVLRDEQVSSTLQQRRLAVVSREWVVDPGGKTRRDRAAADFVKDQLDRIAWDSVTSKMLFGVFYGWSVAEMIWARDGRFVVPEAVMVRKVRRFRWGVDGSLRLLTLQKPQGEVMPPRKFWTFAAGADNDDDPYGLGLAHWLYWPVWFKRNDIKFWLIFLEKFGAPTALGKYGPNAKQPEIDKLLAALDAIQSEGGIVIPEGMAVELLEAARSGTADYDTLFLRMDAAIAKVVLSQTMTTDPGSSRAQAEVHMDVRDEVVKADSDLVNGSFNRGPVTWLTEWNFPGAAPPMVWRRTEDEPDLKPVAERDKMLFDMGYRPSPQYVKDTYGEGYEDTGAPPEALPGGPRAAPGNGGIPGAGTPSVGRPPGSDQDDPDAFADNPAPADVDDAIDGLVAAALADSGWERLMDPVVAPLREAAAEAASYEDLKAALAARLADMDTSTFAEVLARSLFAARLAGETEADITGDEE